jgi:hypothetical protein
MNQIDNIMALVSDHERICCAFERGVSSLDSVIFHRKELRAAIEQALKMEHLNYLGCMEDLKEAEKTQPKQEPESFEAWYAKQHGDPEEIGFLQALRIAYCAGQDSVTKAQPQQKPLFADLIAQHPGLSEELAALDAPQPQSKQEPVDDAIAAGDGLLMTEQAALLRECRAALDSLIQQKPTLAGLLCGSTTLGNLKASLYDSRPQGVFGSAPQPQPCNPAEDGVCEALECCKEFNPDWDQAAALQDSLRDHMALIRADREVMRQALEALERADKISGYANNKKVIAALRERLK